MTNYREIDLICLPPQKKYRNQMEIIASILEVAEGSGVTLYSLTKRTGINYIQLKKYLPSLTKLGFMEAEIKEGKVSFRISERGLAFLRQYNILRDMLLSAYVNSKPINTIREGSNAANLRHSMTMPLSARIIKRK